MEMKDEGIAGRRVSRILHHFAGADGAPPLNPHIMPMNCSSTLNSMVQCCNNRLLFARQSSQSQACFMRQVQSTQNSVPGDSSQKNSCVNCSGLGDSYKHSGEPMFSRQLSANSSLSASKDDQYVKEDFRSSSTNAPAFARENNSGKNGIKQLLFHRAGQAENFSGVEWSPRIDVEESGSSYTVTLELPGASITDIRVEVDNQNLTVTGTRSTRHWKVANYSDASNTTYRRREILHGPYRLVWPLPRDANKDSVSAEFMEGFLQIILPKL